MQIIETEYNGYKFRSRLEARWAVFFDACGVEYEYEPEGYVLSDGSYYLPDFLLHNVIFNVRLDSNENFNYTGNLYVEVKGQMTEKDTRKIELFADRNASFKDRAKWGCYKNPIVVLGNIPLGDNIIDIGRNMEYKLMCSIFDKINLDGTVSQNTHPFDWYYVIGCHSPFLMCIAHNKFTLSGAGLCLSSRFYRDSICKNSSKLAYRLARQARFEHGETPNAKDIRQRVLRVLEQ